VRSKQSRTIPLSLHLTGCDGPGFNCYPLTWKTTAEYYQEANVTWQVWQNVDNWEDNPFSWFEQFINAPNGSAYQIRGNSNTGLDAFFRAAHEGTLPQVSFIVSDQELTEVCPSPVQLKASKTDG
jgi:phospholipase C